MNPFLITTWSDKSNAVVNIGVYFPFKFNARSDFMSYLFTAFHVKLKGGILGFK